MVSKEIFIFGDLNLNSMKTFVLQDIPFWGWITFILSLFFRLMIFCPPPQKKKGGDTAKQTCIKVTSVQTPEIQGFPPERRWFSTPEFTAARCPGPLFALGHRGASMVLKRETARELQLTSYLGGFMLWSSTHGCQTEWFVWSIHIVGQLFLSIFPNQCLLSFFFFRLVPYYEPSGRFFFHMPVLLPRVFNMTLPWRTPAPQKQLARRRGHFNPRNPFIKALFNPYFCGGHVEQPWSYSPLNHWQTCPEHPCNSRASRFLGVSWPCQTTRMTFGGLPKNSMTYSNGM